jgi:hypothetical protein
VQVAARLYRLSIKKSFVFHQHCANKDHCLYLLGVGRVLTVGFCNEWLLAVNRQLAASVHLFYRLTTRTSELANPFDSARSLTKPDFPA